MKFAMPKITNPFRLIKKPTDTAGREIPPEKVSPEEVSQLVGRGITSIKDIIAPSAIEIDFDHLKIGSVYFRTLFVSGYPRFVNANWLYPLISFDHSLEIAMFVYPRDSKEILDNLKRKIGEMEATIQSDTKRGRVIDPAVQVALDDALGLQQQLAKGSERFFQLGLYVTIPADSIEELEQVTKQVKSTLGALLIVGKNATLQMDEAFKTTIPICTDKLMVTRNMDTTSLATTFPFTSSELTANEGILYGINEHNDSLIIFDRFTLENANSVVLGKSGGGKSLEKNTIVLIKDTNGAVKLNTIGHIVDEQMSQNPVVIIDEGIEGVINPKLEVFTFDNNLKSQWAKVTVAARKTFSRRNRLYRITTSSGREITVTADHNLVVLRNGKVRTMRSEAVKIGERIPLSKILPEPQDCPTLLKPALILPEWPKNLPQQIHLGQNLLHLLGLITSEGLIREKLLRVFNIDREILQVIKNGAKTIGANTHALRKNKKIIGYGITPFYFAKLFTALGLGGKSGEKRIPPLLFSLSNQQVALYLQAYFEGDGTIHKNGKVSATSKSKELISDLCYLFLRFGIVGRIRKKFKRATNSQHQGDYYYDLVVSGKENLTSFTQHVGFLTREKNDKLQRFLVRSANTNIDTVPTLGPVLQKIYQTLFSPVAVKSPTNFSPLMRGFFAPSRDELKKIIAAVEERIDSLKVMRDNILFLKRLPNFDRLCSRCASKPKLNHLLWQNLGYSWQLMKKREVIPGIINVLRAYQTVSGETIAIPEVKYILRETFSNLGISLEDYDDSLYSTVAYRKNGDTSYERIYRASQFISSRYRSTQLELRHAQEKLNYLKLLANSDLFWDPIAKIERIKHREKYVYDLTVDNEVFLAGTGGMFVHNSYLIKLEAVRTLMFGAEVIIIDPEAEYKTLCDAIGGQYISFSFNSNSKINPFDLSGVYEEGENELGLKILSLHGLFRVIMGNLNPSEDALLDRAIILTYKQKGITPDPATQKKEPPLMEDLYKTLIGMEDVEAKGLADRIEKFIKGSLSGIFDQKSTVDIKNTFTVFSIKELEDELRPIAMYIILDYIWTRVKRDLKKRLLIIDEAWYLMKYPDSATFVYSIAKRARKYYLGLTTITQDIEDFLASDYGKAIVNNSSIQILLKQSPAAVDMVAKTFYLSEGEKHLLLAADVGEGLFFAGQSHVAIRVVASPDEHKLITSRPEELIAMQKEKEAKIAEQK
ncbi:hypothetical protein HY030_03110 [Candidatus Gottesmanbacteria bacterium]|nr:hypothetical protein [Candidatus Gottesmanbacteria bacterium]